MDFADFLLARFAEDEARAREAVLHWMERAFGPGTMEGDPDWVDAMTEMWVEPSREPLDSYWRKLPYDDDDAREIAAAYADHPDYREEWRPSPTN